MQFSTTLTLLALIGLVGTVTILAPAGSDEPGTLDQWQPSAPLKGSPEQVGKPARVTPSSRYATDQTTLEPASAASASVRSDAAPWAAQVTLTEERVAVRLTSSRATTDEQRYRVGSEIQQELKRVGCYEGAVDGEWNAATKSAMSAFLSKLNASLPHDEADYILLTMVQGHVGKACGVTCPSGQDLAAGKCVSSTMAAKSGNKSKAVAVAAGTALGAPSVAPAVASAKQVAPAALPNTQLVIPVPQPVKRAKLARADDPAVNSSSPKEVGSLTGNTATVAARPALPGRMSIGGPVPPPLSGSEAEPPATVTQKRPVVRVARTEFGPANGSAAEVVKLPLTAAPQDQSEAALKVPHTTQSPPAASPARKRTVTILRPQPVYVAPRISQADRLRRMELELIQRLSRN